MTTGIQSPAFANAMLRAAHLRSIGVIVTIAVFALTSAVRILLFGSHMNHIGIYAAIGFLGYEVLVLRAVNRGIKSNWQIPPWFWAVDAVIEMSMPAVALAFLASDRLIQDYRPLASPWALLFFPFLILSTLRLSASVSTLAGVTGAVSYLLAARVHGWHIKSDFLANPVTHSAVPFFAVMICASGIIAAVVAREIRTYVEAALREAENERQLKQVEHDLSIARSIQQSLLPKVRPDLTGYEIAGWNRPADATGGDYFDWKQLEDGRLVITLADVTGHGIGPALLASVCRAYARSSFGNTDSLASTFQRINESFGEDLSPGQFATFVAAVCKAGDDRLELLSAGQAPLFWYSHQTGRLNTLPAHDVPLGILPRLTSESSQIVSMQEGDIILLVTDGFLEWENVDGEDFGALRLEEVVRSSFQLGPEEIIAQLYDAVLKFAAGSPQKDDLTAVVIKRSAESRLADVIATGAA